MKKTLLLCAVLAAIITTACSSKTEKSADEIKNEENAFEKSQPLQSGTYTASYFDITGENARKGNFDGRILVSLSEDLSVIYVYENGNRTKIDYLINLEKPFEKTDSVTYTSQDKEGKPVVLTKEEESILSFEKKDSQIKITFDPNPNSTQPPMDILQKINELAGKK